MAENDLKKLRNQIDQLDQKLLEALSERMKVAVQIGHFKKAQNLPVFQQERWNEMMNHRIKIGKDLGLDENFLNKLFEAIHVEAVALQEKVQG